MTSWMFFCPGVCEEWQGLRDKDGYGRVYIGNHRYARAHRLAFERARGPIPAGHQIHHMCGTPPCVNAEHMVAVTPKEHKWFEARTHCIRGHEFDQANTYIDRRGERACRACGRAKGKRRYADNRDEERRKARERYHDNREEYSRRSRERMRRIRAAPKAVA